MTLADISIRNHVFAWMLMFAPDRLRPPVPSRASGRCSAGLGISQNPDVDFPVVNVSVTYEGASPEIMETDVVDSVEDAVTSVEGVKEISSTSRQGSANVTIEFELERNIDVALQDVQTQDRRRRRTGCRASIDPPDRHQDQPRGPADHVARALGQPPAHLHRRLHPQRAQPAAPDDRGRRRDPARRLPRAQRARLVRRHAARGPGPHGPGRHRARSSASTSRCRPGASRRPSAR